MPALASYKEAEQLQREIGDKRGLGTTLINVGTFYDDRGEYDQGLQLFKESLQIQRETGNQSFEAFCLNNIGNVVFVQRTVPRTLRPTSNGRCSCAKS